MGLSNLEIFKLAIEGWHESKGTNFDTWLDHVHDDITMRSLGERTSPEQQTRPRVGKAAFRTYLEDHRRKIDLQSFHISNYIEQSEQVVGFGTVSLVGRQTGKRCTSDVAILSKFRDGKIIELMEFFDTRRVSEALSA